LTLKKFAAPANRDNKLQTIYWLLTRSGDYWIVT
jgi:hypothetical protein